MNFEPTGEQGNPGNQMAPDAPKPAQPGQGLLTWYQGRSKALQAGIGCGVLVLACGVCGVCGAIGSAVASSGSHPSVSTIADTVVVTQAAQATANPNAGAHAYEVVVIAQSSTLSDAMTKMATDCGASTAASTGYVTCRADMQAIHDDAAAFVDAIRQTPAPPCLQSADQQLRTALSQYEAGAALGVKGIDDNSGAEITAGAGLINQGNTFMGQATTAVQSATC
jgi:hypothetical protein